MDKAVHYNTAVDAIGSSSSATANVGKVNVEDIQRLGLTTLSSLRG